MIRDCTKTSRGNPEWRGRHPGGPGRGRLIDDRMHNGHSLSRARLSCSDDQVHQKEKPFTSPRKPLDRCLLTVSLRKMDDYCLLKNGWPRCLPTFARCLLAASLRKMDDYCLLAGLVAIAGWLAGWLAGQLTGQLLSRSARIGWPMTKAASQAGRSDSQAVQLTGSRLRLSLRLVCA